MPACSSGSETLAPTKHADRLDFCDDHRDRDPLRLHSRRGGRRHLNDTVDPSAQVAYGAFTDPAAIDVENELGPALNEHDSSIDCAQDYHRAVGATLCKVVDDAALQFERDDFQEKHADSEPQEQQL